MQKITPAYRPTLPQIEQAINTQDYNISIWVITPDIAERLLEINTRNRSLRQANIKIMVGAMRNKTWRLTGDSIKIGSDGQLKDGQNRLHACVKSQAHFTTFVLMGMDPASFDAMDTGIGRSARDIFSLNKPSIPYAQTVAGAAQWMAMLTGGSPLTDRSTRSPQDLLMRFNKEWKGLDASCTRTIMDLAKQRNQPVSLLVALHYIFSRADMQKADQFFDDWLSGAKGNLKRYAPIQIQLEMIRRLQNLTIVGGRMHDRDRLVLIVMAWNAFYMDKPLNDTDIRHVSVKGGTVWPGIKGVDDEV